MTQARESFEKWARIKWPHWTFDYREPEGYIWHETAAAFETWQAATEQTASECAEIAEHAHYDPATRLNVGVADVIRAKYGLEKP